VQELHRNYIGTLQKSVHFHRTKAGNGKIPTIQSKRINIETMSEISIIEKCKPNDNNINYEGNVGIAGSGKDQWAPNDTFGW
jgi:hypothetical protein